MSAPSYSRRYRSSVHLRLVDCNVDSAIGERQRKVERESHFDKIRAKLMARTPQDDGPEAA